MLKGDRSSEKDLEKKWNDACYANKFYKSIFATYVTADAAKDAVGCKDDIVFAE
jgi:hypothetical protein